MKGFKDFLVEQQVQNKHLEHVEDLYLFGSVALRTAEDLLSGLVEQLSGSSKERVNLSVKWDGAPAVICGTNPENGKFFVGTKSVFNKTPKINYTNKDIDENHGHSAGLAEKLKVALAEFPKLGLRGILQGDFLFTKRDLKRTKINGETHIIFQPNTIVYAVPANSTMGKQIASANAGVAFHTTYTGRDIKSLKASFGASVSNLKKVRSVWVVDVDYQDTSGNALFDAKQTQTAKSLLANIKRQTKSLSRFADSLQKHPELVALLKRHANHLIRTGSAPSRGPDFVRSIEDFIADVYNKRIESLRSESAKAKAQEAKIEAIKIINANSSSFEAVRYNLSELSFQIRKDLSLQVMKDL